MRVRLTPAGGEGSSVPTWGVSLRSSTRKGQRLTTTIDGENRPSRQGEDIGRRSQEDQEVGEHGDG